MEVKKSVKLYLYRQELSLGDDKTSHFNIDTNNKIRYILSPYPLIAGNIYDDIRLNETTYNEWIKSNWYPIFTNFNREDCLIIEETHCGGWNGLFNMLPILNSNMFAELKLTASYNSDYKDEDVTCDDIGIINYMATHNCYVLKEGYDELMLGWEDDKPFYKLDDGYVKWDVVYRHSATSIYKFRPLVDLFMDNSYDGNGAEKPYKATIKIEGKIQLL